MRFREILEARKNPAVNNERNGRAALFDYLESLDSDELKRTYVHFSTTAKLGINPNMSGTGEYFEPVGIFTYPARNYIKRKGDVQYGGNMPIAHVITIKPEMHTVYNQIERNLDGKRTTTLYAKLQQKYPDIKSDKGRVLATKYLINQGYNLILTLGAWPEETVILNPKAIEKDKIITVEFLQHKEGGSIDPWSDGDWTWDGPTAGGGVRDWNDLIHRKIIPNKEVLSRSMEYALLYRDPRIHKKYVDQVLTPQGLQSKLSAQEIQSIAKKQQSAGKRRDNSNPTDLKWAGLRPSMMSAKRLFDYGAKMINQGKQLSKSQEKTLAQKGASLVNGTDLLPIYYKLLQDAGMSPLLTATELEQARRMVPTYDWE